MDLHVHVMCEECNQEIEIQSLELYDGREDITIWTKQHRCK